MTEDGITQTPDRSPVGVNIILSVVILACAAGGAFWIRNNQPQAQKTNNRRKSAALVETVSVERKSWSPQLIVLGTVRPAQEVVVSPRVRGQVQELAASFVPGEMVRRDDILLKLDPADFENTVSIRRSELEQVQADREIEQGRQTQAEQELKLLGDSIAGINRSLVLREPQAASLRSQLSAATAALERAQLDLERTSVPAPFDAHVLRRSVNVGSQVQPGDDLGRLVGVDQYWVMAAVPVRHLSQIDFKTDGQEGSAATLTIPDVWPKGVSRKGKVTHQIGALDEQTRLARVLVTVDDPLGLKSGAQALILDTIIEVRITGKPIQNVARLRREYVRDGDTVWLMQNGELKIQQATIEFRDAEFAYISGGLESGDEVVTTTLATVANGVKLRKTQRTDEEVSAESDGADDAIEGEQKDSTPDNDAGQSQ